MKSIRTQMRCSGSIVSTVAIKFAKCPVSISTLSPEIRLLDESSVPDASHLRIKLEITGSGSDFGDPLTLTSLDAPVVLLMAR
jgi:hypothetical protein